MTHTHWLTLRLLQNTWKDKSSWESNLSLQVSLSRWVGEFSAFISILLTGLNLDSCHCCVCQSKTISWHGLGLASAWWGKLKREKKNDFMWSQKELRCLWEFTLSACWRWFSGSSHHTSLPLCTCLLVTGCLSGTSLLYFPQGCL